MPARLVLAISTGAALLFANQVWLDYRYAGSTLSWWRALAISAADWYLWAMLTPLVVWLGARFPVTSKASRLWPAVHLPASVVVAMVKVSVDRAVGAGIAGTATTSSLKLFMAVLIYWVILGGAAALAQARASRVQELRAMQMEAELTRAQLETLRTRLQPHFLFNTLNVISALMREDAEAADRMLTRLSDLLRLTLQRAPRPTTSLREELEVTQHYLAIQQARFGDRLSVTSAIEPEALDTQVPTQLLQPLIENAFQHGIAHCVGEAHVTIRTSLSNGTVTIEVEDSGPGPAPGWQPGVGISTTRDRLTHLYGSRASLTLVKAADGGAVARVTTPVGVAA